VLASVSFNAQPIHVVCRRINWQSAYQSGQRSHATCLQWDGDAIQAGQAFVFPKLASKAAANRLISRQQNRFRLTDPPRCLISRAPLAVDRGALSAGDVDGPVFGLGGPILDTGGPVMWQLAVEFPKWVLSMGIPLIYLLFGSFRSKDNEEQRLDLRYLG
jgi:hypothetical protein